MDRMVIVDLPVSVTKAALLMEALISPSNMESPIPRFTRAHGLHGGHTGIGMRMSSGGILHIRPSSGSTGDVYNALGALKMRHLERCIPTKGERSRDETTKDQKQ